MACLLFQGLSGLLGGIGLVADPTGGLFQMPLSWLEGSPFGDYLIPGWILLLVLGVFPLVAWYGLVKRWWWSWLAAGAVGIGLVIWVLVQIRIIGYHPQPPFQLIYGLLGVVILGLSLMPSIRQHLAERRGG